MPSGTNSTVSSETQVSPPNRLMVDTMVLTWLTDPRNPRPDWEELTRGRVHVERAPGIFEMTWSFSGPDGRATFEWVEIDGQLAVRWRRIGGHEIFPRTLTWQRTPSLRAALVQLAEQVATLGWRHSRSEVDRYRRMSRGADWRRAEGGESRTWRPALTRPMQPLSMVPNGRTRRRACARGVTGWRNR